MSLVTARRWANRRWAQGHCDLVAGAAEVLVDCWGVPLGKRLAHHNGREARNPAKGARDAGARFALDAYSELDWYEAADLSPFEAKPGELAHLCDGGGAHVSCLRLSRVPDVCEWRHALSYPAGVRFGYQPPLTSDVDLHGTPDGFCGPAIRPAAVVGSYAVKDITGNKVAHILRPRAVDRDGHHLAWGTLAIARGESVVTFKRADLLGVRGDVLIYGLDTIGYGTVGGTSTPASADYQDALGPWGSPNGTMTAISLYCYNNPGRPITLGYWDDDGVLVRDTAGDTSPTSAAWKELSLSSPVVETPGRAVWLGANHDTGSFTQYWDAEMLCVEWYNPATYAAGNLGNITSPTGNVEGREHSIKGIYTAAPAGGGGAVSIIGG